MLGFSYYPLGASRILVCVKSLRIWPCVKPGCGLISSSTSLFPIQSPYLSDSCPDTKEPQRTPTKNREVVRGVFQSSSHTRFHCQQDSMQREPSPPAGPTRAPLQGAPDGCQVRCPPLCQPAGSVRMGTGLIALGLTLPFSVTRSLGACSCLPLRHSFIFRREEMASTCSHYL